MMVLVCLFAKGKKSRRCGWLTSECVTRNKKKGEKKQLINYIHFYLLIQQNGCFFYISSIKETKLFDQLASSFLIGQKILSNYL